MKNKEMLARLSHMITEKMARELLNVLAEKDPQREPKFVRQYVRMRTKARQSDRRIKWLQDKGDSAWRNELKVRRELENLKLNIKYDEFKAQLDEMKDKLEGEAHRRHTVVLACQRLHAENTMLQKKILKLLPSMPGTITPIKRVRGNPEHDGEHA